jgi:hypothetical protein
MANVGRRNILIAITVIAAVVLGYILYFYFIKAGPAPGAASPIEAQILKTSREFLNTLLLLEATKIDTSFFQNSRLTSLRETRKIPPVPTFRGRSNPFEAF